MVWLRYISTFRSKESEQFITHISILRPYENNLSTDLIQSPQVIPIRLPSQKQGRKPLKRLLISTHHSSTSTSIDRPIPSYISQGMASTRGSSGGGFMSKLMGGGRGRHQTQPVTMTSSAGGMSHAGGGLMGGSSGIGGGRHSGGVLGGSSGIGSGRHTGSGPGFGGTSGRAGGGRFGRSSGGRSRF
jgi:hypothetical protein